MKKIIYIAFMIISSAMVLASCTEEDVKPVSELENGGGNGGHDKIR